MQKIGPARGSVLRGKTRDEHLLFVCAFALSRQISLPPFFPEALCALPVLCATNMCICASVRRDSRDHFRDSIRHVSRKDEVMRALGFVRDDSLPNSGAVLRSAATRAVRYSFGALRLTKRNPPRSARRPSLRARSYDPSRALVYSGLLTGIRVRERVHELDRKGERDR